MESFSFLFLLIFLSRALTKEKDKEEEKDYSGDRTACEILRPNHPHRLVQRRGTGRTRSFVVERVEHFVERLGPYGAIVAELHQRVEERRDVDDAGGSRQLALVVLLL